MKERTQIGCIESRYLRIFEFREEEQKPGKTSTLLGTILCKIHQILIY
jgi:hypothetical protein